MPNPKSTNPDQASSRHQQFKTAEKAGHLAEARAVLWYRLRGFRILARRWQSHVGEIDIIARRGRLLVFFRSQIPAAGYSSGQPVATPAKTDHAGGVIIHRVIDALPEL